MDTDANPVTRRDLRWINFRAMVAAGILALVLLWGSVVVLLERLHDAALETTYGWAEGQAATLSQSILRAFEAVNALHDLVRVRQLLLQAGDIVGATAVETHLRATAALGRFGVVQVAVIGTDGIQSWGSAPGSRGTSLGDRAHFLVHARDGERGLAISQPLIGRTTDRWSVQVTHALEDPAGAFDGVAVVSIDPLALSGILRDEVDGPGRRASVRRIPDGTLIARSVDVEAGFTEGARPDHPVVQAAGRAAQGRLAVTNGRDDRPLLAAYKVLHHPPLVVTVAFDAATELRGWRQQRAALVTLAAAMTLAVIGMLVWINARRRLRAEQRRWSREQIAAAETLARQRAEILAVMAHEIRTPLTGVLGFGELLVNAGLPPEQHRHAEVVVETGRVLLAVVNDILDLAKIEAGRVSIETQPFRPAEALRQALALSQALSIEKGLRIVIEGAADLPAWVSGDATRIRQVVGNLLSNAVKFTERGTVTLRATTTGPATGEIIRLRIEITDTGIGIPAEVQRRLFGMFEQAEGSRRYGGTGLGLAICKRLVEAMQGEIGVDSQVGRGSAFWCELPLRTAVDPQQAPEPLADPSGPTLDVLVADDVATNRMLIHAYLVSAGHRVVLVEDGVEAVAAAQGQHFDAILMDVNMPNLDGTDAARRLRLGNGPNARTPIIALTASTSREERERVAAAGMDLHLPKPVSRAALLQAVRRVVALRH